MRLQLPTRVPVSRTTMIMAVLFCVQQMQHSNVVFSLLFFTFVLLGNVAFNLAGGFARVTGAYIFFYVLLTCGIGVVVKAFLGESAESNLQTPLLSMAAYTSSMAALTIVALFVRRLIPLQAPPILGSFRSAIDYTIMSHGCLFAALLIQLLGFVSPGGSGSLIGILIQLNAFPTLALIFGTIGALKDSNGAKTFNFASSTAFLYILVSGLTSFSKQGMLTPGACWLVSAFYGGARIKRIQIMGTLLYILFALRFVPLLSGGRNNVPVDGLSFRGRVDIVIQILTHQEELREQALSEYENLKASNARSSYYNTSVGLFERLTMLKVDSALFEYSRDGNYFGYYPITLYFENIIPHFIFPDKPQVLGGNDYAHLVGGLAEDDHSTGISYSPPAEAFLLGGWICTLLVLPAIQFCGLYVKERICGNLQMEPWGLFAIVVFAHSAAESGLGGLVYDIVTGNLILLVGIFYCTRFAPILGTLVRSHNQHYSAVHISAALSGQSESAG